MDRKIIKPIVMSALSALAFGAVGTAGTFALFTDNATTQVPVTAGRVDLSASITLNGTYSAQANSSGTLIDEFGGKYSSVATAVAGTFTNGGTAAIDENGFLELERITPGDRVTFTVTPALGANNNVDVKYRVNYRVLQDSTHNMDLAKGLVTKVGTEEFEGLEVYRTAWTLAHVGATLDTLAFDVELPINRGNEYQEKSATIAISIEGVQGNAAVADSKYVKCYDDWQEEVVVPSTPNVDVEVEASNSTNTASVKTTIPAEASEITAGDTVRLLVSDVETVANSVDPTYSDLEFDATLFVNDVIVSSFSENITVEVQLPTDLIISSVKHKNVAVTGYTYNSTTGILRFETNSFSPFVITYKVYQAHPAYGFPDNFSEGNYNVHIVNDLESLKAIGTYLNDPTKSGSDTNPLFRLANDIDVSQLGSPIDVRLRGTLDGNNHKFYGDPSFTTLTGDYSVAIFTEYDNTKALTVQDLSFENMTVEATGQGAALLIGGYNTAANASGTDCNITFNNVHAAASCSVHVDVSKAASFIGKGYGIDSIVLNNCSSSASISADGTQGVNIGGFVSTFSNNCVSVTCTNCVFSGDLYGDNYIGGFFAQCNNGSAAFSYSGCKMLGTITSTASGAGAIGFFHAADAGNKNITLTFSNCTIVDTNGNGLFRLNSGSSEVNADYLSTKIKGWGSVTVPGTLSDSFVKFSIGELTLEVDPTTQNISVTPFVGAHHYRAMVKIDGKAANVNGNSVSLYNTRGITISSPNYASVGDLAEGFGQIHRIGYIVDDAYELNGGTPTVFSLEESFDKGTNSAYIDNNRMNFLRVSNNGSAVTAIGGLENVNKVVKEEESGEWLLVVKMNGTVISPVGADCNYTIQAFDSSNNLIAYKSFKVAAGSSMVPHNMSNMAYNYEPNYSQPYYEYSAS